ncbi:hypothetical protein PFICI_12245 [Pestalotiopsis fici W106-1]|uniref:ubiquitinyl hydrolase 1 n=1 Tax=Pestalotiopsis fici (strain W106-1 / CGMCC3.15140) TaxID=1229662 RepID=W3WR61_PESFW|nr:uncharacterized protein PFICI_12245 [Pestalotiopsis fici W106-1]ETS75301.1 hypothetical protein PFICI_12245 [Pestalotiopsis fici W106-1]
MKMHMFLLYSRDELYSSGYDGIEDMDCGEDLVLDRVHLLCVVPNCQCKMVIERLPPRISLRQVASMFDKQRVARNLEEARAKEPGRLKELEHYDPDIVAMLQRYSRDCLDTKPGEDPRRIKLHNKKFMVAFKNDFDVLWRSLGCTQQRHPDGDEAWVFPVLEESSSTRTNWGTFRARWEDVEAECRALGAKPAEPSSRTIRSAWDMLKRVIGCAVYDHENSHRDVEEADIALLGCCRNFKPKDVVQVAVLLAERCPQRYEEFIGAAARVIKEDYNAAEALAMYQSEVESRPKKEVLDAFKFFDASIDQRAPDHFISRYLVMVDADKSIPFKKRALECLQIVGNHLGTDLSGPISPEDLSLLHASSTSSKMSVSEAKAILNSADLDYTDEILQDIAQDVTADRARVAEALEVFAEHHQASNPALAAQLVSWAGIFKSTNHPAIDASPPTTKQAIDPNTPPGLHNIGNTCYLNSLLQYLFSVTTIRDLVVNYPDHSLDLNSEAVTKRRLGFANGLEVSLEEAIVGRQFVECLQSLFKDLLSTPNIASEPSQKLANTALRSASTLLEMEEKARKSGNTAPPLPARPSPGPPESTSAETNKISVTVQPINDSVETASNVSSQTLVDDYGNVANDNMDENTGTTQESPRPVAQPTPSQAPDLEKLSEHPTVDIYNLETVSERISQLLEQSDRKGTDQQDVEEIIGFIIEHLMRSISSNGPMPGRSDLQADTITETFFPIMSNYVLNPRTSDVESVQLVPDRWINAFPHDQTGVSTTIYQALDRNFTLQMLEDGSKRARYNALHSLPPILHIRIQRLTSASAKNTNPILLVDELYLDRYMDTPRDSKLALMRSQDWAMRNHRLLMEDQIRAAGISSKTQSEQKVNNNEDSNVENIDPGQPSALDSYEEVMKGILDLAPHGFKRPIKKRNIDSSSKRNDSCLQDINALLKKNESMAIESLKPTRTEEDVAAYYESLTQHKYRLHAIICHSGNARAGHYWIWIRDFERNVWIKYNDSTVTVDTREPQAVIDELNTTGDPCYVAYVRDADKSNLVGIPKRAPITQSTSDSVNVETIEGVAPDTDTEMPDLINLPQEHAANTDTTMELDDSRPYQLL